MELEKWKDRLRMIKAMEFICRQVGNEELLDGWFMNGVADGHIEYGDLNVSDKSLTDMDIDLLYTYAGDNTFGELMGCFLRRMAGAYKSGGLYCGGVLSKE